MRKAKIKNKLSDYINDNTFLHYYSRLSLLAKTMFEWVNLPESINARYLEYALFENGKAVFFEDKKLGLLCLKAQYTNLYNVYREPTEVTAVGENGYQKRLKASDCVVIRNNDEEIPTRVAMELFAYRLYDVERTADINVATQKMPYLILCDDKQVLTMKNLWNKISRNEPAIFGVKNAVNLDDVKVHDLKAPFVANELNDYKTTIWNEAMTFLGVKNANLDKKERLITDEVQANDEQIMLSAEIMLKSRKDACKLINEKFGLNIDVRLRATENVNLLEEGDDDVSESGIHNNTKTDTR